MQREPVLRTARDGMAEPRSEQVQPDGSATDAVRPFRDLRRVGVTLLGVVLLFGAVFAGSYAFAHQEHQHHAQAVLLGSERAAMAKIAAQSHGASCQVAGVQPGPALGHPHHPRPQPQRPGGGGHRRPGAQRGRRARPAVGLAGGRRRRGLPGPRRQLLRAPQPAQAGRRDHVPDGVQHGEVPGERPAGRPRRLGGVEHDRPEPGARHLLAAQRALLHPGPPAHPGDRGGRRHQGRQPRPGRAVRADGRVHRLHDLGAAGAAGAGPDPRAERGAHGDDEPGQRLGGLRPVARARSPWRRRRSRPTSAACTRAPSTRAPWWAAMAPRLPMPPQLAGAAVTGHDAPLDVEIDSSGGTPTRWSCAPR